MRVAAALVVARPRARAREQDLAMLPAHPATRAGGTGGPAPRDGAAAAQLRPAQTPQLGATAAGTPRAASGDEPITQADLKHFVDETLQKERSLAAGAPGVPAADREASAPGPAGTTAAHRQGATGELAHHPTWYDTHSGWYAGGWGGGHWHRNHWCYDNPEWHGPFGDPCVAYATGGDRQFWCEWDGAGADNACPRSCGTCSWRSYYKDETSHERKEHLLREHFDPQEPPPEASGKQAQAQGAGTAAASHGGQGGPVEPKRVAQRRSMTGALLKQVSEMKERLMEVAKATRAVATEVALSRTNNHHLSAGQAKADLANFFQHSQAKVAHKHGESDSSAIQDLISFFDHEPGGKAEGKGTQLSSLREKVAASSKAGKGGKGQHAEANGRASASSSPQIVAHLTRRQKEQMAHKAAAAKKAAAAHRLSSDAATKDIENYWGAFQAKTQAVAKERGHRGMTSQAANKDLDSFLSKMVAKARVAHRATEAAAEARRAKTNGGKEAVPVKHLSDKQAREEFEDWWHKDMATPSKSARAAASSKTGQKHPPQAAAQSRAKSEPSKGLAVFSAEAAAKELESFWQEEFPTPRKAHEQGDQHPRQHHQDVFEDRRQGKARDREREDRRRESRGEGEERQGSEARRLGVPEGREEAVRISHAHRTTSEASRGDLDDYFGKMLRRDNIAAAKQRLKEHPAQPAEQQQPRAEPVALGAPEYAYAGYPQAQYAAYPQVPPAGAAPAEAAPYMSAPQGGMAPGAMQAQGGWQQMPMQPVGPQMPAAQWPQTSLLNPMQAAFGAAYDGYG